MDKHPDIGYLCSERSWEAVKSFSILEIRAKPACLEWSLSDSAGHKRGWYRLTAERNKAIVGQLHKGRLKTPLKMVSRILIMP